MTAAAPPSEAQAAAPASGRLRAWLRDLVRSAAAPVICAVVLIAQLAVWVSQGGAGTVSRVSMEVSLAAIPMSSFAPGQGAGPHAVGAYLTIRNLTGSADQLTAVTSPDASRIELTRPAGTGRAVVAALTIPGHGVVTLSPFGPDVTLTGTGRLRSGQRVPLTLVFRKAGHLTVQASVTAPGAP